MHVQGWQALPESVLTLEALAVYCQGPGKGRKIDLGGRHLRTSGGYETEFGFVWHEHPYPHWHLPLLSSNMGLRNGELLLCPRVMLVSRGTNMEFQNLRIFGAFPLLAARTYCMHNLFQNLRILARCPSPPSWPESTSRERM